MTKQFFPSITTFLNTYLSPKYSLPLYFTIGVMLVVNQTFSQDHTPNIIPPSPEAASLGKYAEIPVSLYTGTPDISIPIATIQEGPLSLPVSVQYHSAGIRVEEVASFTGIGWTLNAGGVITRTVNGLPDDFDGAGIGFLKYAETVDIDFLTGGDPAKFDYLFDLANSCTDAQPDQFYFNVNGMTGKMNFDWDGSLIVNSSTKVKVTPIFELVNGFETITGWDIVTPTGTIYKFREVENSNTISSGLSCFFNLAMDYTSSWYLSEISDLNGENQIYLSYDSYELDYDVRNSVTIVHSLQTNQPECSGSFAETLNDSQSDLTIFGKRISQITTSSQNMAIDFTSLTPRTDISGVGVNSLDQIVLKDYLGDPINTWDFGYDYSTNRLTLKSITESNGIDSKPPYLFDYNTTVLPDLDSHAQDQWGFYNGVTNNSHLIPSAWVPNGAGTEIFFQGADRSINPTFTTASILEKITYPTGGIVEFTYEQNDYSFVGPTEVEALEEFELNLETVQASAIGNSAFGGGGITTTVDVDTFELVALSGQVEVELQLSTTIEVFTDPYFGAGFDPKIQITDTLDNLILNFGVANYLGTNITVLKLPAGFYKLKSFATWKSSDGATLDKAIATIRYDKPDLTRPIITKQVGGVRVKSIKELFGINDSEPRIRTYDYSWDHGKSSGAIYGVPVYSYQITNWETLAGGIGGSNDIPCETFYRFANNVTVLGSTQGSHIGYRRVCEFIGQNGENGSTVSEYTSPVEYPDIIFTAPPFQPATSSSYRTGLLGHQAVLQASGDSLTQVMNEYNFYESITPGLKVQYRGGEVRGLDSKYDLGLYYLKPGFPQIKTNEKLSYGTDVSTEPVSQISEFFYDQVGQNIKKQITHLEEEQLQITEYFYHDELPNPNTTTQLLLDKNVVGEPAEVINQILKSDSSIVVTTGVINEYISEGADKVRRQRILSLSTESPIPIDDFDPLIDGTLDAHYENEILFEKYNSSGNINQYLGRDGVTNSFIWGYNGNYPVARIVGATYDQAVASISSGDLALLQGKTLSDNQIRSIVDIIRQGLPGAQVSTFTYQPPRGMTSQTDPRGKTITYEYDDLNRLKLVRDHNDDIVQKYEYAYGSDAQ